MTNLGHCANELMPQIMPACKAVTDRRYRRNCFNAAQYGSAVRCRARHASPRLVKKVPSGLFSPSCFPNCKIKFCSMILQFCRCGGLFDAKGHPDGFLSHFPSLRNFRLSMFLDSLAGTLETACLFFCNIAENSKKNIFAYPLDKIQNGGIMGSKEVSTLQLRVLKRLRRMRRMLLETPRRNSPPERRMRL